MANHLHSRKWIAGGGTLNIPEGLEEWHFPFKDLVIVFLFRGCRGCTSTKAQDLVGEEASVLSYWTSLG